MSAVKKSGFWDLRGTQVADFNQGHAIFMPVFQDGMLDQLKRDVTILNRIPSVAATGYPSRYWEQTKLPQNSAFVNVRGGGAGFNGYQKTDLDEDYGREEKILYVKCVTSGIKYNFFETGMVQHQGDARALSMLNKDMKDMGIEYYRAKNKAIWNGTGTGVDKPADLQYTSLITQLGEPTDKILKADTTTELADTIRTRVALQMSDENYDKKITAIYANPVSIDVLERELKKVDPHYRTNNNYEVRPGLRVMTIITQAGDIPIIPDVYLPVPKTVDTMTHQFVCINEEMMERQWAISEEAQVFKMGTNPGLLDEYIMIGFDNIVLKGKAGFIVTKETALIQ